MGMHNYHIISPHSCSGVLNWANFSAHVTLDQLCKLLCIICMCRQHKYISKCISILRCRHLKSPRQFLVTEGWLTQWSMLSPVSLCGGEDFHHSTACLTASIQPCHRKPVSLQVKLTQERPQHNQCPKRKEQGPNVHPQSILCLSDKKCCPIHTVLVQEETEQAVTR
jgi:hypothetical protein